MRKILAAVALAICLAVSVVPSAEASTDPWWFCTKGNFFVRQSQVFPYIVGGYNCYRVPVYTR